MAAKTWMPGTRLRQGFAGQRSHTAGVAFAKTARPGMTSETEELDFMGFFAEALR
jgi:hypothetical protein